MTPADDAQRAEAGQSPACCGARRTEAADEAPPPPPPASPSGAGAAFRWIALPGGPFLMGTSGAEGFAGDGEGPARTVTLSPFRVSAYAVTNAQFADFVGATGYVTEAERFNWSYVFHALVPPQTADRIERVPVEAPWWLPVPFAYWAQPEGPGTTVLDRLDHPVVHVSWNDAAAFCNWSGTRLLSEAEWEYAARGGLDGKLYPWGDDLTPDGRHRCNIWQGSFPDINTAEDGYVGTAPVHAFEPNGYGLFNVAGNVWEWVRDVFSPGYHRLTSDRDPFHDGPGASRSMRGGSYLCHSSYCNRYRVAARNSNTPNSSSGNIGFRVAALDTRAAQFARTS